MNWEWDFGDGTTSIGSQNLSHSYSVAGSYNVALVVTNDLGCTDTLVKNININQGPVSYILYNDSCIKDTLVFSGFVNDEAAVLEWLWVINNAQGLPVDTLFGQHPSYVFDSLDSYEAVLMVTDTNGCMDM